MMEPMKLTPMMEMRFGSISTRMMRQAGSPSTSAAMTNSFSRRARVWARMTRAP
jgi:hypothetical protein